MPNIRTLKRNKFRAPVAGDSATFPAKRGLRASLFTGKFSPVKLLFNNLPASLAPQRETLARCLEAMNRVMPLRAVYLFGSHARGDARPDSDVDLCVVADGAAKQLEAAQSFRRGMRPIPAKPSFTLVPITPDRLGEKKTVGDHFFRTVLQEGVLLAAQD